MLIGRESKYFDTYASSPTLLACASSFEYVVTRTERNGTRKAIAENLRSLLDMRDWSEHDLAKHSKVAQKTINNILNNRTACQVDTVDALARVFGLTGWQLMIPNLKKELLTSPSLQKLVEAWAASDDKGREHIEGVAYREATYNQSK